MDIAVEMPIVHLKELSPLTDFDFCLGPLALRFDDYRRFYENQIQSGRTCWLDNGANEGRLLRVDRYLRLAEAMGVHYIIAPDYLGESGKTIASFERFLTFYNRMQWPIRRPTIAVVAQGENWEDSRRTVTYFSQFEELMICLPWRVKRTWRQDLQPYHFLGLNSLSELSEHTGRLPSSIDTSLPVRYATLGKSLNELLSKGHLPILNEDYFTAELAEDVLTLAAENIQLLKNVQCKAPHILWKERKDEAR